MNSKKQLWPFLIPEDEAIVSGEILNRVYGAIFVDGGIWGSPEPPIRSGIHECTAGHRVTYIALTSSLEELRTRGGPIPLAAGQFRGALSRTIQYERFQIHGEVLIGGRLAVGYDSSDNEMNQFVSEVWKAFMKHGCKKLNAVSTVDRSIMHRRIPGMIVGWRTIKWLAERPERVLRAHAGLAYYMPDEACINGSE